MLALPINHLSILIFRLEDFGEETFDLNFSRFLGFSFFGLPFFFRLLLILGSSFLLLIRGSSFLLLIRNWGLQGIEV